jgi:hypothetical protein
MGGNQFNMTVDDEFETRRTVCGREGVEIKLIWPSVLNSQDDAPSVGENGWTSNQPSLSLLNPRVMTHDLWVPTGGN